MTGGIDDRHAPAGVGSCFVDRVSWPLRGSVETREKRREDRASRGLALECGMRLLEEYIVPAVAHEDATVDQIRSAYATIKQVFETDEGESAPTELQIQCLPFPDRIDIRFPDGRSVDPQSVVSKGDAYQVRLHWPTSRLE